jgi:hypothetical protein
LKNINTDNNNNNDTNKSNPNKPDKNDSSILLTTIIIAIVILVPIFGLKAIGNYIQINFLNDSTKELFKSNIELRCVNTIHGEQYLVSKKRGWIIYKKNYFLNDKILVDISNCYEIKE